MEKGGGGQIDPALLKNSITQNVQDKQILFLLLSTFFINFMLTKQDWKN